jgi:hypothetical protein
VLAALFVCLSQWRLEKPEMDAMRKQLDVLMGANRNGDVREVNRKYYDRDVCRLYLVGLCPHELFQLTVLYFCFSLLFILSYFPFLRFLKP